MRLAQQSEALEGGAAPLSAAVGCPCPMSSFSLLSSSSLRSVGSWVPSLPLLLPAQAGSLRGKPWRHDPAHHSSCSPDTSLLELLGGWRLHFVQGMRGFHIFISCVVKGEKSALSPLLQALPPVSHREPWCPHTAFCCQPHVPLCHGCHRVSLLLLRLNSSPAQARCMPPAVLCCPAQEAELVLHRLEPFQSLESL